MIRHILLWNVAEEADAQQLADLLNELPEHIDLIRSWNLGPHRGDSGAGNEWEYALVCDFDSLDELRAYHADPFHVDLIPRLEPMIKDSAVADIELRAAAR